MGVFLLFDPGERLIQLTEVASGDFGAADPLDQFFPPADAKRGTHSAIELAPEILLKVRPEIYRSAIGHSRRQDGEIVVDDVFTVMERLRKERIRMNEELAFRAAQQLAVAEQAVMRYWPAQTLPDHLQAKVDEARADLQRHWTAAEELRDGRSIPVPGNIGTLCGQRLPL